jgi:fructan beta-fructosidase
MLKMDVFRSKTASGSGAQYFVGQFDGRTFTEEPGEGARPVDAGRDFYAAASWSNLPPGEGRQIWIAWMNNHEYAKDIPTAPFRGTLTVPREVSLRRTSGGTVLVQTPVREVEALRRDHRRITDLRLTDRGAVTLAGAFPRSAEIEATFAADGADEIGLMVRVGPAEQTVIGYDIRTARIFIDRTRSGRVDFNGRFPGTQSAPLPLADGKLTLRVLLDRASIEVFAGDGAVVLTEQVFPSPGSAALEAYARGGPATLRQADLWRLADAAVP